jgi:hypothetical protein
VLGGIEPEAVSGQRADRQGGQSWLEQLGQGGAGFDAQQQEFAHFLSGSLDHGGGVFGPAAGPAGLAGHGGFDPQVPVAGGPGPELGDAAGGRIPFGVEAQSVEAQSGALVWGAEGEVPGHQLLEVEQPLQVGVEGSGLMGEQQVAAVAADPVQPSHAWDDFPTAQGRAEFIYSTARFELTAAGVVDVDDRIGRAYAALTLEQRARNSRDVAQFLVNQVLHDQPYVGLWGGASGSTRGV